MKEQLNSLLMDAMKSKDNVKLGVLRAIKSEFTKFETAAPGNVLDEAQENKILKKMQSSIEDSIEQFKKGNRLDLAENEHKDLLILKSFLPKEASEEEMSVYTKSVIEEFKAKNNSINMSNMKHILEKVKEVYPYINGKIVSTILKQHI